MSERRSIFGLVGSTIKEGFIITAHGLQMAGDALEKLNGALSEINASLAAENERVARERNAKDITADMASSFAKAGKSMGDMLSNQIIAAAESADSSDSDKVEAPQMVGKTKV